jgi:hypothetical protein
LSIGLRIIAEYQFEQRHNEREAAFCLIRAAQDRSLETLLSSWNPSTPGNVGHHIELLAGFLAHS